MKKAIIFLIAFCLSIPAYAQLSDAYKTVETKVTSFVKDEKKEDVCPVYADTPMSKVKRQPWEVEIGFNAGMFPSNGPAQFRTDALTLELIHNLSSAFGVYLKYDTIRYEKYDYENSVYERQWDNYSALAGVHLYVTPVIRVFGGVGKVYAKDKDGNEPTLGTAIERGLKYDIPLGGYKLVGFYKAIEAALETDSPDIEESTGTQVYSVIGLSLSVPFGYDQ